MSQKALNTSRNVENKANMMYNLGSTEENVKEYFRDAPIREKIKTDFDLDKYYEAKWDKHDPNNKKFDGESSQITITKKETVDLIKRYAGTGTIERTNSGSWRNQETIYSDTVVGKVLSLDGKWVDTKIFKIHYSEKNGVHLVPSLKGVDKK